ncbi:uncharacterized protein [Diadema setosum]|uniref:uncharacterized protein n=1 Tax=Diadema setosum TaxID=31175 RepID=UPI003B3A171D
MISWRVPQVGAGAWARVSYITLLALVFLEGGALSCPSPPLISNSSTCLRGCCCNYTVELVNCSNLNQNVQIGVIRQNVRILHLDWNAMDTLDRGNCSALGRYKNLKMLSVTHNRLTTINANCFKDLKRLTTLNFSTNALTQIPTAEDPYTVQTLDLSNNKIRTINQTVFKSMPNLTALYLHNNEITTLPSKMASNTVKLKILSLRGNSLTTISPDAFGPSLEELYLANNNLSSLGHKWLVGTFNLRVLDFRNATSQQDADYKVEWKYPGFASKLTKIDLSSNGLRSIIPTAFDSNNALQTIDVSSNALQLLPKGLLFGRVNLTTFIAHSNLLVNISRSIWGKSTSLEYIDLSNNSISQVSVDAFRSLGMLRYLDLSGNRLVSVTFLGPRDLPLETLSLNFNDIGEAPTLNRLAKLRILRMRGNRLREIPNLQNLSNLEEVDLSWNNISMSDMVAFAGSPSLKQINLEGNKIVSIDESSLEYLPRGLLILNLVNNSLRCDCKLGLNERTLQKYQWGLYMDDVMCASPQGMLLTSVPQAMMSCPRTGTPIKSIILLALLAGIVVALIILGFLYSKYRRISRTNSARRRSYPVEEKSSALKDLEEAGHLMAANRSAGSYHNLRGSRDLLGQGSVAGSCTKINGSAIKPFEEEFYV